MEKYQLKKLLINTLLRLDPGHNLDFMIGTANGPKDPAPHGYGKLERSFTIMGENYQIVFADQPAESPGGSSGRSSRSHTTVR